jgi:hypothetical protein
LDSPRVASDQTVTPPHGPLEEAAVLERLSRPSGEGTEWQDWAAAKPSKHKTLKHTKDAKGSACIYGAANIKKNWWLNKALRWQNFRLKEHEMHFNTRKNTTKHTHKILGYSNLKINIHSSHFCIYPQSACTKKPDIF